MPSPDRSRRELRNRAKLALWLALPFIGLMLLVSPRGDFPLNDDWVYAKMVQALANDGYFGLSPFSNAFALTQTLYAAPLVKLFGFSFTLLRLTTIFMGWVTVCFTAFTARELGLPNRSALLAALTVFVNPLFINLSYTFMTDVPFCAFASISMFYFVRAFRTPSITTLLSGTIFSIAAFYTRQFALVIPFAFALAAAASGFLSTRKWHLNSIGVVVLPWICAVLCGFFLHRLRAYELVPATSDTHGLGSGSALSIALGSAYRYFGFFFAPIALAVLYNAFTSKGTRRRIERRVLAAAIIICPPLYVFMGTVGVISVAPDNSQPQIIRELGTAEIGPATLGGPELAWFTTQPSSFQISKLTSIFISYFLGGFMLGTAILLVLRLCRRHVHKVQRARIVGLAFAGVGLLGIPVIAMPGVYLDRYYLPALAPVAVMLVLVVRQRPAVFVIATFFLAALFTMSVIGLQDYMSWNSARWRAVEILRSNYGAADFEIDGGYEFNGMYTSDEYVRQLGNHESAGLKPWWVIGDRFKISPLNYDTGYKVIKPVPYFTWLGFTWRNLYVLEKRDLELSPQP